MPRLIRRPAVLLLALSGLGIGGGLTLSAVASTPASQATTVPAAGSSTTLTWSGTIPAGSNPITGDCSAALQTDSHDVALTVPAGAYDTATTTAVFSITWDDAGNDEILEVDGPGGSTDASDTSDANETVTVTNPVAGTFQAVACPFAATSAQAYTGKLVLTSTAKGATGTTGATGATGPGPDLPSADAQGLAFSASVPSDPQRDVAEPLLEIDPGGRSYTCGPTGFSNVSDYSNTSDDGGDQFHLLGTQPRGQQGSGGGGDCGLGTGVKKNATGGYQYAYAGLGPLTGFTTSTSPDAGKTLTTAGPQGNTNTAQGGLADRQWLTFLNDKDVLLNYNQQRPRNVVVQKSTDGGFSYVTGNDAIAGHNPNFPGPMRTMPSNPADPASPRIAYFSWNGTDTNAAGDDEDAVYLSVSDSTGLVWKSCLVQRLPAATGTMQAFTVADNDRDGNIYVAYADEGQFHTYLTHLTAAKLKDCDEAVPTLPADTTHPTKDPGWSAPVQVDRDRVRSTIFPWMVAGGAPGHVAVSYYGTESDGDPNTGAFKASWDVYVDQTTDALAAAPHIGQVKATTHPIHYDSICLLGLACDLSTPAGDRGLGDFFAIDLDPKTHKLELVYNNTAKLPDDASGSIAAPMVVTQTAGPSNDGGTVTTGPERATVRTGAADPTGDALLDYSQLNAGPVGALSGAQTETPALDLVDEQVGPEVDPASGALVADGGFTVTMKLADLKDAALAAAIQPPASQSLVYAFRFVNGFQPAAAVAKYDGSAFSFGFDDYTTGSAECGSPSGPKCEIYPGLTTIKGKVDQAAGTITLSVPRKLLTPLKGTTGPGQRPTEKAAGSAVPGDRFYDATSITFANPSPDPSTQTFMVNTDNVRAMDFLLPGTAPASTPTTSTTTSTPAPATTPPATTPATSPPPKTPAQAATEQAAAAKNAATAKAALRKSSARIRIIRTVRRNGRLRLTLRTTNGSVSGTTVRLTRGGRTILRGSTKRVGTKGVTFTLRVRRGARLTAGRYRLSVRATGASKARAGGVVRLR